jgi:hypothetical protein
MKMDDATRERWDTIVARMGRPAALVTCTALALVFFTVGMLARIAPYIVAVFAAIILAKCTGVL